MDVDVDVDPDEPRYCLCGDVSFGNMVCCENSDVRLAPPGSLFFCDLCFVVALASVLADGPVVECAVRARMVPFRMRRAQRAAGADDEVVLSGVSEAVGGWGEGAGACWGWGWWLEGGEEEVRCGLVWEEREGRVGCVGKGWEAVGWVWLDLDSFALFIQRELVFAVMGVAR